MRALYTYDDLADIIAALGELLADPDSDQDQVDDLMEELFEVEAYLLAD